MAVSWSVALTPTSRRGMVPMPHCGVPSSAIERSLANAIEDRSHVVRQPAAAVAGAVLLVVWGTHRFSQSPVPHGPAPSCAHDGARGGGRQSHGGWYRQDSAGGVAVDE